MGISLFGKRITDVDMCFVRDLLEIAVVIKDVSGEATAKLLIQPIIEERGLEEKVKELIKYTVINDCYPYDRQKLIKNAEDYFSVLEAYEAQPEAKGVISYTILKIVKKMGLSYDEKVDLICKYILNISSEERKEELWSMIINDYITL